MAGQSRRAAFSRTVEIEAVRRAPVRLELRADADERRALAERLGLQALDALAADATVTLEPDGRAVRFAGRLVADVVQTCVVSLEPVPAHIETEVERVYARDAEPAAAGSEDPHAADPPEPLTGDRVDLGEAVAEELALALEPYPRKPGAEIPAEYRPQGEARESPFAVLQRLQPN